MPLQTKIAQYVSLGVGIVAILVSMVLANGEIKSAYEWFNGFMGLVLGVLGAPGLGLLLMLQWSCAKGPPSIPQVSLGRPAAGRFFVAILSRSCYD